MARPTLTVVGKGSLEPDAEVVETIARAAERMAAAVKDPDGLFWIVTAVDGDVVCAFFGGQLESAVLAESVAGDMKREAVGL